MSERIRSESSGFFWVAAGILSELREGDDTVRAAFPQCVTFSEALTYLVSAEQRKTSNYC